MARAAEQWGAEWTAESDGGTLSLPVVAGLHRGWIRGALTVHPAEPGTRLTLRTEESHLRVHRPAVAILSIAGVACVGTLALPFFPRLLAALPLAAVLALAAWFLVLSKLHSSGPDEFLALVAELAEAGPPDSDDESPP